MNPCRVPSTVGSQSVLAIIIVAILGTRDRGEHAVSQVSCIYPLEEEDGKWVYGDGRGWEVGLWRWKAGRTTACQEKEEEQQ